MCVLMPGLCINLSVPYVYISKPAPLFSFQHTFEACEAMSDVPKSLNECNFAIRGCGPALLILAADENAQASLEMGAAMSGFQ